METFSSELQFSCVILLCYSVYPRSSVTGIEILEHGLGGDKKSSAEQPRKSAENKAQ